METISSSGVLTARHFKGLRNHKYSAEDNSIIARVVMRPFWDWILLKLPLWIAPNLLTFIGLLVNICSTYFLIVQCPQSYGQAIPWTYLIMSLSIFIHQTLDAVDGQQARRTGTSSPLGELFDHGSDAYNCLLMILGACIATQSGPQRITFYIVLISLFTFYSVHWKTFVTGKLEFGFADTTAGEWILIFLHLLTFFFGAEFWHLQLSFLQPFFGMVSTGRCFQVLLLLCGMFTSFSNLYSIIIKNDKPTLAQTSVLQPIIPFGVVVLMALYSYTFAYEKLYLSNTSLYLMTFGTALAKVICLLIVAHMSRTPLPYYDQIFLALAGLCINVRLELVNHDLALLATFFCVTASLVYYSVSVCSQLCKEFKIRCFTI
ncbi:choline/ethanolaminephosphotransferase 1-like [Zophobas morio]|jgi:choline/ethanolamine phosphotransferase|uniref:choline/ethanolaminephosphotransferase 1-like n=1 Tax=Zophobas morio TaxID=2755281 RepID=UPI0030831753